MDCPDCKGNIKMVEITTMYLEYKDSTQELAHPYYKCPKCKMEIDVEE